MDRNKTIEHMKNIMWKFPSNSKEYELAQKCLAWFCNRIREEEKVRVVFEPPIVGSLEEKISWEAEKELAGIN